jgi:D-methionine transport system ATP-binding protein
MIRIDNISVSFASKKSRDVHAVRDVSLEIRRGEIFGIVGTSGAGKSTLLRTVNLLQKPSAGKVFVGGTDVTEFRNGALRTLRRSIGMIFQQFNLMYTKTVAENVALAMRIAGKSDKEISERVPFLLSVVGLSEKAGAYPSQLSGGQKQRVGIARALANNPEILLCDEPTSALDNETTRSILELLRAINGKFGITIVIISHEMDVIKSVCSRVAVMSSGRVVEAGDTYDIFSEPKHEVTRRLVDSSLNLEIPDDVKAAAKGLLLRVIYRGDAALDPVIADAAKRFCVNINIIHGRIEYIAGRALGVLVIGVDGEQTHVTDAYDYIKSRTSATEVIHG